MTLKKMYVHVEIAVIAPGETFDDIVKVIQETLTTSGRGNIVIAMNPAETLVEDENTGTPIWRKQ